MQNFLLKLLFNLVPKIKKKFFIRLNRIKFNLKGIKFGENLCVFNRIYIILRPNSRFTIGNNFIFTSGDGTNPLSRNLRGEIFIDHDASIEIGNNTGISSACIWAKEKIKIGNNVKIGGDCIIMDTDAHNLDFRIRRDTSLDRTGRSLDTSTANSSPIVIEDDVFIGTKSIILKGVTIGARSIIAAGSVVTKSLPADCIAGGNPCRVIKYNHDR